MYYKELQLGLWKRITPYKEGDWGCSLVYPGLSAARPASFFFSPKNFLQAKLLSGNLVPRFPHFLHLCHVINRINQELCGVPIVCFFTVKLNKCKLLDFSVYFNKNI